MQCRQFERLLKETFRSHGEELSRTGRAVFVQQGRPARLGGIDERLVGVDPAWARAPALMTGACIQFLGNRSFTFRAQAGRLSRQARLFLLFESLTLALNWGLYQGLLKALPMLAPEVLSFIGTFLVFVSFNYPLRKNVIFLIR